jgi:hypothetical protein
MSDGRKPPLIVHGMHGMGDNIHQRGIVRQLMAHHEVFLQSTWICIYHDLIEQGLHVIHKNSGLRTQVKNAWREQSKFYRGPIPARPIAVTPMYHGYNVNQQASGTILEAMCKSVGMGVSYKSCDFRLPIPADWYAPVDEMIAQWKPTKPILVYRPLVSRPEWQGSAIRNASSDAYTQLFAMIRDNFFVVSVADLIPGREWIVGPQLIPNIQFHHGELPFESLAALFSRAKMAYTSSGFGSVLAPAVGTPCINIVGGYERAQWHWCDLSPVLGIEPIHPCSCATSNCRRTCDKRADIPAGIARIRDFLAAFGLPHEAPLRLVDEMFSPAEPEPILAGRTTARQNLFARQRVIYNRGEVPDVLRQRAQLRRSSGEPPLKA